MQAYFKCFHLGLVNAVLLWFIARLQERFVTPSSSAGPCPSPSFTNVQEFFKGFIQSAARYITKVILVKFSCT